MLVCGVSVLNYIVCYYTALISLVLAACVLVLHFPLSYSIAQCCPIIALHCARLATGVLCFWFVLYCIVLYLSSVFVFCVIVLYCSVVSPILTCMGFYCNVLYCFVYCIAPVLYSIALYCVVLHCHVLYCPALIFLYCPVLQCHVYSCIVYFCSVLFYFGLHYPVLFWVGVAGIVLILDCIAVIVSS